MKILMLTPYLPYPPSSGGQIRTFNILKHLTKEHEITLVALYKNEYEKSHASWLDDFCRKVYVCKRPEKPWQLNTILRSIAGDLPFLVVRNYSQEAREVVEHLLKTEEFDVIHAETFYIMPHIPQTKIPILLVEQTVEYKVYNHFISSLPPLLRYPLKIDTMKLKRWEKYYWSHAQLVATVSDSDAKAIHSILPSVSPVVIPNGASESMFEAKTPRKEDVLSLLFIGNFSWLQNAEAAEFLLQKVLPLLKNKKINPSLVIAGQNIPDTYYQNFESVKFIAMKDVTDEYVRDIYRSACVFVAPIFGPGGTRLKILSAMATKTPIITTKIGAEGLQLEPNKSYLEAETPEEFARAIEKVMSDEKLRLSLAEEAYEIAKRYFSWESITEKLIASYQSITSS